jgi:hypothetical protein
LQVLCSLFFTYGKLNMSNYGFLKIKEEIS